MTNEKRVLTRLHNQMRENNLEIGKLCTELQYYEIKNDKHVKIPFLQWRLKKVLMENYTLVLRIKGLEK